VTSNCLEHSGITSFFDPIEDVAEIVFTFVFLFFVNNWRKDRSEARFRALFQLPPMPLAEITMAEMDPDDRFRKNLSHILDAAQRSADLTRQLPAFARKQDSTPTIFDMNESIEATVKMREVLEGR
jgi:hypothetical protein